MSDIVERLRKLWFAQNPKLTWDDMEAITEEAADEITRLRAAYEAMDKMLREANQHFMKADMERNKLRAENETLRRDVKTAIMGDSAELQDVKRENKRLQKQSVDSYNAAIDVAAMIAKTWGPPNWSWSESSIIIKDTCDEIALAIRGLKNVQRETKTESPVSPEMLYLGPIDTK